MKIKAIRSIQACYPVYSFFVEFQQAKVLFSLDNEIQRKLMPGRVNKFKEYLKTSYKDFIFPAVTASIDCDSEFFKDGVLNIDTKLKIHDGQHRIAGVIDYVNEYNHLRKRPMVNRDELELMDITETFPVTLYHVFSQDREKKIFFDINKNSVKPTKRILDLFNPYQVIENV